MCCDASAIPNHISANPNATIMALSGRAADFVITNVLGKTIKPSALPNRGAGHDHDHDHDQGSGKPAAVKG
jgi:choline dehydrogenase-like flavoprotein